MASKRPSAANDIIQQGVKRRLQFTSGEEGPESVHMHHGPNDDGHAGTSVSIESFEGASAYGNLDSGGQSDVMIREQDRFLPIANVSRIMKRVLPESGKVAKEAKECVQECVSEFISFITSEASERCMHEKRKTINGEDILWAMQTLGFDPYVEPLKVYLSKYRMSAKGDKNSSSASATVSDFGLVTVLGDHDAGAGVEGKLAAAGNQVGGQIYLTQEDLVNLGAGGDHRQMQLATSTTDGQLTIIEMRTDGDGNVDTGDGNTITLPMISGSTTGENGAQQYILTTLDQSGMGGAGVQQFTIPAGAQLAFIPANGANGQGGSSGAQGIPVMFLDSANASNAGGHQQSPQYITMNAGGTGGLQIIHVGPTMMATSSNADDGGRGDGHPGTLTMGGDGH